jgi:FAD/FMN-containing dehydrogenase
MSSIKTDLKNLIQGDVDDSDETRELFSHDASMFELKPELVVAPKDSADVQKIVKYVAANKKALPNLSLTVRSAGTDMSGAAVNDSIILDFAKYFTAIEEVSAKKGRAQPGVFYRDFEKATLAHDALMPSFPASRDLCTIGGMVNNNAGGEKSLVYGKTERFIEELQVVFADGNEYTVKPLDHEGLKAKMAQKDFEGKLYRDVFDLVDKNYDAIKAARPNVSKDSTGYHIWDVWDRETGRFELNRLITGAQGTLGITTDITFRLVPAPKHSGTLVVFLRRIDELGIIINKVMKHKPETFEGFDNYTLMLSFRLFYFFHKTLGWPGLIKLAIQLIPDAIKLLRGIPKMVLLIEFTADTAEEVKDKVKNMHRDLEEFRKIALFEEDETEEKAAKFWIMRRQSFNILRQKVHDKHTAPFMDDLIVPPHVLPQFLPEIRRVIKKYKLLATIAGHMGDGNFHIIPLMKIEDPKEKAKLEPAMMEINDIVLKYKGSLSGEHNDGMIRGPWLEKMYGPEVFGYFKRVKEIFDPENIFNPHKKTDSDWDYSMAHLREHF